MGELRNLKSRIDELEGDLRDRDEEVKVLKDQGMIQGQNQTNGGTSEDGETIKVRNTPNGICKHPCGSFDHPSLYADTPFFRDDPL